MTDFPQNENRTQAEETLRLLAKLPAPSGIETRVHNRLAEAKAEPHRQSLWAQWLPPRRFQFAGAALVAVAVAVSTWTVYRSHPPSPVRQTPQAVVPQAESPSGFKTAGAERRPSTVAPIRVQPAPKKKPSASKAAKRTAPKVAPVEDAKAAPQP